MKLKLMIVKSREPSGGEKLRENGKRTNYKSVRQDVHTDGKVWFSLSQNGKRMVAHI